jgi:dTDP-4-amino-4,6-dideoxygalactose transaminase
MITNDPGLADKLAAITHHGMRIRYHYDRTGVNSRLDTLQAAILRVKLKHLDEYSAARNRAADWYDKALKALPGIKIPERSPFSTHVFHQYTLQLQGINREELRSHLERKGIPSMVYYPLPIHLQKAFLYLGYQRGDFPVSEQLCKSVLSLPMHTELEEAQVSYIADSLVEFIKA